MTDMYEKKFTKNPVKVTKDAGETLLDAIRG